MKLVLYVAAASVLVAQQPSVSNAKFEAHAFSGSLDSVIRSADPAWFGYEIATPQREYNDNYRSCALEDDQHGQRSGPITPVQLEGSQNAALLFRVANNQVEKVRLYSLSCPLDAGGRRFVWLTGVPAETSLVFLEKLTKSGTDHLQDQGIFAIAQHATPAADDVLERLTRPDQPVRSREKATFWLGASRGARGVGILKNILAQDPSEQVRDKAVFALSISKQPEAMSYLIQTAEHDSSAHVRGQAIFWLAQKAGAKAAATIQNAIENDPDTEVKKKAVFAMSQLPKDEGVPKLIEIARTQRNREVRKQAFFWLGQSNDPRALAFFEQVLTK